MHARLEVLNYLSVRRCWGLLLLLPVWGSGTEGGAEERPRLEIPQVLDHQPFLRWERPAYRNYAFHPYTNYPNHASPYADTPRSYYSSLGDYLSTGYDLFTWTERRMPGLEYGSALLKEWDQWSPVFDGMIVARDGHRGWGYSAIVGDGLIARFTPLTLSMANFNGLRLDLSIPHVQFTVLGSRIEWPNSIGTVGAVQQLAGGVEVVGYTWYSDRNTLLLGSRMQMDLGALQVGLNGVNLHVYETTRPGNSLKGVIRSDRRLYEWLMVRFADDSPADGRGGVVVQKVELVINGEVQPDLQPSLIIRQQAGVSTQLGSISQLTGEFTPRTYTPEFPVAYYIGRSEFPLYADYLYRAAHEAGQDVRGDANLEGLLRQFTLETPGAILRADGDEQLVYLFDLRSESYVESMEVKALVGNDYRVDVATISENLANARTLDKQYASTFFQTVRHAEGNVQDLSNLGWVRFAVGENTAMFTYSADVRFSLPGLEINGEYARSAIYSRYPAQLEGKPLFARGKRSVDQGAAYFVNAIHWFGRGRVGAEYFSMNPEFKTTMSAYLPGGIFTMYNYGPYAGVRNETVYWDLIQDNEDGDRYPDVRSGSVLGQPSEVAGGTLGDSDGVFQGLDEDNDGLPDTNRNANDLPDYEEPFLLYEVEPNDYVYGLDRNHNDEADVREDDLDPDHPYDPDQRGYHLFGQVNLSRHWSVGAGRYAVEQIVGAGRNKSTYALLTYRREAAGRLRRLFFENHFRRVQDSIADEFLVAEERAQRWPTMQVIGESHINRHGRFAATAPLFVQHLHEDLLAYQDSDVNETYLEGVLNPWSTLHLVQKLRSRLNWQQGGQLPGGRFQRERRLDYWTVVSRADYTRYWGNLSLTPQFKFLLLRLVDQDADIALRSEYRVIPILRLAYPLLRRTLLQAGLQGFGPLPYRVEDRVRERGSFEQRTAFISLTNRSRYFGYDLYTIIGLQRDEKKFEDVFQQADEFDGWSFFVHALVGFTEYGRLF